MGTKVASISAGVIGYSYALKFAMGGHEVWAQNRTEESSALAKSRVEGSFQTLVKNGVYSDEKAKEILSRIHYTTSVEEAVKDAMFIQESSAEHYDVKHEIVKQIEEFAPEDAVIASSTSGL
ncbi:MAG: 3-hydroxyacyl-CoA dehydrogenase NAD-binding domain-containing protein, partial [Oribacterium sp.]|nr:3-hydroxyacyl-CoA dehydrogenase NAD-binding domain-containing protein [Oribacterium sp.]